MTASLPFKNDHGGVVGIITIGDLGVTIAVPFAVMSLEAARANLHNAIGAVDAAIAFEKVEAERVAAEKARHAALSGLTGQAR